MKKGISIISLIITIIVIVILAGIVIVAGYKFINEGENAEKNTIAKVVSEAVEKFQDEKNIDPSIKYIGYKLEATESSPSMGGNISQNIEFPEDLSENTNFLIGEWYLLDINKLKDIGVENTDKFLNKYVITDFLSVKDSITKYGAVLVNYETAESYVVKANKLAINLPEGL